MLNELAKQIHENAKEKGWHDSFVTFGETIALCHAELSEALEEYRNGNPKPNISNMLYYSGEGYVASQPTECCKKPEVMAVEMADVIIRILDWCVKKDIDIEQVIKIKHEYNKTRSYRHNGKVI